MLEVDEAMLRMLNGLSQWAVMAAVGRWLSSPVMIFVVTGPVAWWLARRRRCTGILTIALAMGAADLVVARVLKPAIQRERPCRQLEGLVRVAPCGTGKSMPSGHAAVAFAFFSSASRVVGRGRWWFAAIATAVALSRVLLGVHYPSDILVGAGVGVAVGWTAVRLGPRWRGGESGHDAE